MQVKRSSLLWMRRSLLALSISLIIIGLAENEHLMVLQKAVKICLECIGIG